MAILDAIGKSIFKFHERSMKSWMEQPIVAQEKILNQLITQASTTEWGKKYEYAALRTPADFTARVPINTYEDIAHYVDRMLEGERDVLWPGIVSNFSKSSGTTNAKSKFIPVPIEALTENHYKAGKEVISLYLKHKKSTQFFSGKHIAVGGSFTRLPKTRAIVGDVSALLMRYMPWWVKCMQTLPERIALMPDWEAKAPRIAEIAVRKNVVVLAGVPTWTVHLLRSVLAISGKQTIKEIWPNLEVFFHGGVSFTPYRSLFEHFFTPEVSLVEVYNASEGYFAAQDDPARPGEMLLLTDHGVFYEFIELDTLNSSHPVSHTVATVEVGKVYALVITTIGGLARYLIGDTVIITSTAPLRIKIVGRTKQYINVFGEELMIGNAEEALARVGGILGTQITDFTVGPVFMDEIGKGGHEWVIEFAKPPHDVDAFGALLDRTLRELNSDYDAKRAHDMALVPLKVYVASPGTFYEWMKSRGKLGGQHKVPRLSNTREYIDTILEIISRR